MIHDESAYTALLCAILEQAVYDLRVLQRLGLITDGQPIVPWPKKDQPGSQENLVVLDFYNSPNTAQALIEFFAPPLFDQLLTLSGIKHSAAVIRAQLQLSNAMSETKTKENRNMAVLTPPKSSGRLFELENEALPPRGTFVAKCVDIKDAYQVERRKYQSDQNEILDITAFLFGFRGPNNTAHRISTREFRISGHPKAGLVKFLTMWLGQTPVTGFNTATLKGASALITIDHQPSTQTPGKVYPVIASISPVPQQIQTAPATVEKSEAGMRAALGAPVAAPASSSPATNTGFEDAGDEIPF